VFILAPLDPGEIVIAGGRRADSGVGVVGKGQPAPPHQLGRLGSAVSFPSGVWGRAPAEIAFGAF